MSGQVSLKAPGTAARPVSNTPEALGSSKSITYGEICGHVEDGESERLEAKGLSQQRVSNFRTARNSWMKVFGLSLDSPVGIEFGSGFKDSLERFSTALAHEGKDPQTIADRKSMMVAYREDWISTLQKLKAEVQEGDLHHVLKKLVESSGTPAAVIARSAGIAVPTFGKWLRGRCLPTKRHLPSVHRLEEIFGLPCGVLAAKLPKLLHGGFGTIRTGLTGYRKHVGVMTRLPYLLKEFPPVVQGEWEDLFRFYTDAVWRMTHGMKSNSKWRIREHDNRCPTADIVRLELAQFLGYLRLPADCEDPRLRGKGFRPEELTLGLISDSGLIYSYLQFKRERTYLKRYNAGIELFLMLCSSLLRPETGFLWQIPELGVRLPVPVTAENWHGWCERHRSVIVSVRKDLLRDDELKKSRDPFEPIRPIINNQHPMDVIFEFAAAYEADAPAPHAPPHQKAVHFQNLVLIKFVSLIPLRVYNLSIMTWRQDGTGNLYQKTGGAWWFRIDLSYLKNHKGAAKDRPFDVPLHPSLWPYVEEFLFKHRPHLTGAAVCDYVFRPNKTCKAAGDLNVGKAITEQTLSRVVFKITQRYIDGCPGFSIHTFRHLVATEYIKNNPAGYAIAAAILNDREETVRKNYAWVLTADKFVFWNDYVSTLLSDRGEDDDDRGEEDDE